MQTMELGQFILKQEQERVIDKLTHQDVPVSTEETSKEQIICSSTEDKKNEYVRSVLTKPKKFEKSKLINPKQKHLKNSLNGPQKLTQQSLDKINKLYFLQKVNRIKEWILTKNDDSDYPYPFLL
ncbi:hypothetical protein EHI8A_108720 [Entamoeba histolytica HM-1:IMSS-B]|uniref:Uncharacterized protein n=6 Tax=Entamoeba histolytica TaxID=5759 RepID=B1N4E8_ENTH1|nr:hypothetical protein EHI_119890 [Entamoeba histolytica HM-1:IMSS]EMD42848.1 Hypothetical protein EHI5A_124670 [Entamoeba histolytica KU27]EMH73690.1 hypothetical protein EHI8A_108720 [Entamoeba histolytica HM-1:IMSS-B]EMS15699.1 hypothetical protein KM1_179070 [Entamoeba histolytica HM-3:IMSS]ENY61766.1 hypothetical protein EHI7A_099750 [Entamoeba histolytica HM-1:IMSS-A]GAT98211.1 hypothetical protein CL6EHI_119890 [Entamoeba histolytica]|eukprot:XP_001914064.1 hypothetical protein EHI_119890 [Entamoeba histolytica HM-1:IMSS]